MRSTYKKLGPYIREVVEKNSDLRVELLLGVSVSKEFIPSIANTVGTDMSRYKIVREKQFAYGPVPSRNSDKISIALLTEPECIISTSYTVFEIIDEDELLSEYLMMWFRRPEFDRYARFRSHGSVRELFGWEEMCDVELPIPSIEKQREIVKEYQTVVDRIRLNGRLNEKLEEATQAIYKLWFVDFEFPMTAEYAESIGKPELAGQPYKSSGGEMQYNEVLEQDISKGWRVLPLSEVTITVIDHRGKTPTKLGGVWSESGHPAISAKNIKANRIVQRHTIRFVDDDLYRAWMKIPLAADDVLMTSEAPLGQLYLITRDTSYLLSQRLFGIRPDQQVQSGAFLLNWLMSDFVKAEFDGRGTGTTVTGIRQSELVQIPVLTPPFGVLASFQKLVSPLYQHVQIREEEVHRLEDCAEILLCRLASRDVA